MSQVTVALGAYLHTEALRSGRVALPGAQLAFADIPVISRAFAPMVREGRFDVSEMAIATFLQARAYGRDLVLLPVVMAARFQEQALLCRADSDIAGPADLAGRRVGVRAYSQTTSMWLRGILSDSFAIAPDRIEWITFEGAHVPEYQDPAFVRRAPPGAELMSMLRDGEVDAVIVGNDVPADPALRTVFPDPAQAGQAFLRRYGFVPVNHLVTVKRSLAEARPDVVADLARALRDDSLPFGRAALQPAIRLALRFMKEQEMLPRPLDEAEVWDGLPAL